MPLATREPTNGGVNTGTSIATSERAGSSIVGRVELLAPARRQLAAAGFASERGIERRRLFLPAISVSIVRRPSNASLP